jgi:3'(2'), 5'-bisphosphate nucleotidase
LGYEEERKAAVDAVSRAARLCVAVRSEMVSGDTLQKQDRSPVTVADFGSQALICQALSRTFPDDPVVAEEDAAALRDPANAVLREQVAAFVGRIAPADPTSVCDSVDLGNGKVCGRYWTLDPIDGTKGFLRDDQYAVALALVEDGRVRVGALACPAFALAGPAAEGDVGALFLAVQGEGAVEMRLDGTQARPMRVRADHGEGQRFVESVEAAHGNHDLQQSIAQRTGITRSSLRMDSQAKYAAVARGDAALYLRLPSPKYPDYREKIWDHAAGSVIVEEAGGTVSDMFGRPLDFGSDAVMQGNRGVVVSNGAVHDAAIAQLASHPDAQWMHTKAGEGRDQRGGA